MKTMENLKLQYQLSNGSWVSCDNPATQWEPARDRTEDFLLRCEKFNGMLDDKKIVPIFRATRPLTRDEVLTALLIGRELRNDKNDWYSNCRSGSAYEAKLATRHRAAHQNGFVFLRSHHPQRIGDVGIIGQFLPRLL